MNLVISPLSDGIQLDDFSCGTARWAQRLDQFFKKDALEQQSSGLSSTHVFLTEDDQVAGFVSLVAHHLTLGPYGIDEAIYGRPSVPCLLIGQLAVATRYQNQGVGKTMLNWSLATAADLPVGVRFLTLHVDQDNDQARDFYENFGFEDVTARNTDPRLLFYDIYFE